MGGELKLGVPSGQVKLTIEQSFPLWKFRTLRWPDIIYLHVGRLFSIQIFDHSAAFDYRDIFDAEKGMLEVYKKCTFIEIDTNLRNLSAIFSNVVFKENAYYWEND